MHAKKPEATHKQTCLCLHPCFGTIKVINELMIYVFLIIVSLLVGEAWRRETHSVYTVTLMWFKYTAKKFSC